MKRLYCALLVAVAFGSGTARGQVVLDDSSKDASFVEFRARLLAALTANSVTQLEPLLNDTIYEGRDVCGPQGCTKAEFLVHHFAEADSSDWVMAKRVVWYGFVLQKERLYFETTVSEKTFMTPFLKNLEQATGYSNASTDGTYKMGVEGYDWAHNPQDFAKRMLIQKRNGEWSVTAYFVDSGC